MSKKKSCLPRGGGGGDACLGSWVLARFKLAETTDGSIVGGGLDTELVDRDRLQGL